MKLDDVDIIRQEGMEKYGFGPESMKRIKICISCGRVSDASQKFCRECGEMLSNKTLYQCYKEKHRYCSNCQTIVSDSTEYCPQCGKRI